MMLPASECICTCWLKVALTCGGSFIVSLMKKHNELKNIIFGLGAEKRGEGNWEIY
jgi:hypothetical protein